MTAIQSHIDDSIKRLTFARELIKLRRLITLYEDQGEDWASDCIRDKCPVDVSIEEAALGNPPIYDVSFDGDEQACLVLDTTLTEWEPEEGTEYAVNLVVRGSEQEIEGKWSAKRCYVSSDAQAWFVVVEVCE